MLTADLVRVTRRQGAIRPRWIDPADPDLLATAAALLGVFERAARAVPPARRAAIDDAVADLVGHRTDPLLFRGLTKILEDNADFEQAEGDVTPEALRHALFEAAANIELRGEPARHWEDKRQQLVEGVAAAHGLTPAAVERTLFADLPAEQRLVAFTPLDPPGLLHRYNLGLAQAVLLRATRLTVSLPPASVGAYRQVFRDLKFFQLIHTVVRRPDKGWLIAIDGPLSLFASSGRYGLAMAQFLPTLLLLERWSLDANVRWGKERAESTFALDERVGLVGTRKRRGQYVPREQEWLEERFAESPGRWQMSRHAEVMQTAGGAVVVPDLRFVHEDGRQAFLEIIGYWRQGTLAARLEQLADPRLDGLVLAVSLRLAGDRGAAEREHPRILWFKQVIPVGALQERLGATARQPS